MCWPDGAPAMQVGEAALIFACEEGHLDVALLLLDRGAKVDAATKVGLVPWHGRRLACWRPQCNSQPTVDGHASQ
jgi:hypothetical protein